MPNHSLRTAEPAEDSCLKATSTLPTAMCGLPMPHCSSICCRNCEHTDK